MKTFLISFFILLTNFLLSQVAIHVDTSFSDNGKFSFPLQQGETVQLTKSTTDGYFLVIATPVGEGISQTRIVKLTENWELDQAFAQEGVLYLPLVPGSKKLKNHKEDGFLVICNSFMESDAQLFRYKNDGSLDTNFGQEGKLTNPFACCENTPHSNSYTVLDDNSILFYNGSTTFKKYSTEGVLETEFEHADNSVYPFGVNQNHLFWMDQGYYQDLEIRKTDLEGNLDPSFGVDGTMKLVGHLPDQAFQVRDVDFYDGESLLCMAYQTDFILNTKSNWLYNVSSQGSFNTNFNQTGYKIFDTENLEFHDSYYKDEIFYIVGRLGWVPETIHAVIYALDKNGNQLTLNSQPFYNESFFGNGYFESILETPDGMYVCGLDKETNENEFVVVKYKIEKLGVQDMTEPNLSIVNPVKNQVQINGLTKFENVQLIDLSGKILLTSKSSTMDVSHVQAGNYLLRINYLDKKSKTFKIIKVN